MMKRAFLASLLIVALVVGGGCTATDRREIIESVAVLVQVRAVKEVEKELIKEGIDPLQAKKVAEIALRKVEELVRKLIE